MGRRSLVYFASGSTTLPATRIVPVWRSWIKKMNRNLGRCTFTYRQAFDAPVGYGDWEVIQVVGRDVVDLTFGLVQ